MIRIRPHVPGFFSGDNVDALRARIDDARDLASLLRLDFVQGWSSDPNFDRFSWSVDGHGADKGHLMAEMKNGEFWVVGIFQPDSDMPAGLPVWVDNQRI